MADIQQQLAQPQRAAIGGQAQFQPPLSLAAGLALEPTLALLSQVLGVNVQQMQVGEARKNLPGLMRAVIGQDRVVVIRNAQKPGERGVVVMSEERAIGASGRGGMSLARLVASFKRSPVRVHSLRVDEGGRAEEALRLGKLAKPA